MAFAKLSEKEMILSLQAENKALKSENLQLKTKVQANLKATRKLVRVDKLTNEELLDMVDIYPDWNEVEDLMVGELVQDGGKLYKVIQAHTRQDDWKPENTPALFNEVMPPAVIPEWVQPTGSHDAYNTGDKVLFEGSVYKSLIDANTWSPTTYPQGWKLV